MLIRQLAEHIDSISLPHAPGDQRHPPAAIVKGYNVMQWDGLLGRCGAIYLEEIVHEHALGRWKGFLSLSKRRNEVLDPRPFHVPAAWMLNTQNLEGTSPRFGWCCQVIWRYGMRDIHSDSRRCLADNSSSELLSTSS